MPEQNYPHAKSKTTNAMRFKSTAVAGYKVFAVSGVNSISFAIDFTKANTKGLLGFAVERNDLTEKERKFMTGFKVFKSLVPAPDLDTAVSTLEHPIQSFVWDDFSAKPDREYEYFFHPMSGTPGHLVKAPKPVKIKVKTEPLVSDKSEHDVFFNRGAFSGRAYVLKFGRQSPHILKEPKKTEALQWLSRDLDEAMIRFIGQAQKGDTLLCAFYEFSFLPIIRKLKEALDKGVDLRIVLDMKKTAKSGDSFPRDESLKKLKEAGIPPGVVVSRTANPKDIMHNKFMVWLQGASKQPKAVWTGSTNLSFGGIHGHTNVGHWLRNEAVAAKFEQYWTLLSGNPGGLESDAKEVQEQKLLELQRAVEKIQAPILAENLGKLPNGVTSLFSPMTDLTALRLYAKMLDNAKSFACITFPFGINKTMTDVFLDNIETSPLVFMLFDEKPEDLAINDRNNVYPVWGVDIDTELGDLAKTPGIQLNLNRNTKFVHTKILLMDPLGNDPLVVSGSANFSNNSVMRNDENMLLIRGDRRAADIYFTEFNRVFNFFYLGMALQNLKGEEKKTTAQASMFLEPTDAWLSKYAPGTLRAKRVKTFTEMKGI